MAPDQANSSKVGGEDLLVVGAGLLGSLVAQLWLKEKVGSKVVGVTNTTTRHEELRSLGVLPMLKSPQNDTKFPYVIFSAPPSGSVDYPADVRAAAQKWNGEGCLLLTSSSAVYDVSDNGICDEQSAPCVPKGRGLRTDNLLNAEEEVLKYTFNRGTHMFYLSKGIVETRADHLVNVIHYEDAATLCSAILKGGTRGQIYMGCDNVPISRLEIMEAVNKSGKYEQTFKEFISVDGPLGKKMNNGVTRLATGWKPKHESFPSFLGVAPRHQP